MRILARPCSGIHLRTFCAMALVAGPSSAADVPEQPRLMPAIVLVVDASAGMTERMKDDNPKIETLKVALNQTLLKYPEECRLSLIAFGRRPGKDDPPARVLRPFTELDDPQRKLFMAAVINLSAGGPDALGDALNRAREELDTQKAKLRPRVARFAGLILVTGGATADEATAARIKRDFGPDRASIGLHIVGVGVDPAREPGLKASASAGRGTFVNVTRAGDLASELIHLRDDLLSKSLEDQPTGGSDAAGSPTARQTPEGEPGKPADADRATVALLEGLRDDDVKVRVKSANDLASRTGPQVIAGLGEALGDGDGRVRRAAADSLATIGDPAVVPLLVKRISDNVWNGPPDGSFTYTDEPYDGFRGMGSKDHALSALERVAPDKVREALLAAKKSQDGRVRTWASRELSARPGTE